MRTDLKFRFASLAALTIIVAACDGSGTTGPTASDNSAGTELGSTTDLGITSYPGVMTTGKVTVCVDASSPAGTYHFQVAAAPRLHTDHLVTPLDLTPGHCALVWERQGSAGPLTHVTVTEILPPAATSHVDHVNALDDFFGTSSVGGPGVTVSVNGSHGGVITFFNVANPQADAHGDGHPDTHGESDHTDTHGETGHTDASHNGHGTSTGGGHHGSTGGGNH